MKDLERKSIQITPDVLDPFTEQSNTSSSKDMLGLIGFDMFDEAKTSYDVVVITPEQGRS